ncbi:protein neprosin-like [Magnolia sinica]|uniref:protein neprosin-like n=1 Tax=Magnolia sinica TaxID=86752 RepID=UPI002658C358|nr:protein neprosin-like [Magnolia sinica]
MELKAQLKVLNKPAVKSIQNEHGDIFDCVDMYKQPAFDHPLLKNHTIHMRPTSYPEGMENQDPLNANLHIGLKDGGCPLGTVPIRRTKMQDLMRTKSLSDYGRKNVENGAQLNSPSSHHYAIANLSDQVLGTRVTMNVWDPILQDDQSQFSLAQLWIVNGRSYQVNTIEAGWIVSLQYMLFILEGSNADDYKSTGCYNLLCPGFVQVSRDIPVGSTIQPTSTYDGYQKEITLQVFKDPNSGDWWLTFGDNNIEVGYWPKSLFTTLADSASIVQWGGEVFTFESIQSPQMGSGHFPDEGFRKSCYMKKLMFVDNTTTFKDIPDNTPLYEDLTQCYRVIDGGNLGGDWGRHIYFGGPGGC